VVDSVGGQMVNQRVHTATQNRIDHFVVSETALNEATHDQHLQVVMETESLLYTLLLRARRSQHSQEYKHPRRHCFFVTRDHDL